MTSKERWTIYPLLFLSLGIALRDELAGEVRTRRVEAAHIDAGDLYVERNFRPQAVTTPVVDTMSLNVEHDARFRGDVRFDKLYVKRIYTLDDKGNRVLLSGGKQGLPLLLQGVEASIDQVNAAESAEQAKHAADRPAGESTHLKAKPAGETTQAVESPVGETTSTAGSGSKAAE